MVSSTTTAAQSIIDKRKADLEDKKQKLAALRAARESRSAAALAAAAASSSALESEDRQRETPSSRAKLDQLVSSLLTNDRETPVPAATPAATTTPTATTATESQENSVIISQGDTSLDESVILPSNTTTIATSTEPYYEPAVRIPPKVYYDKSIQTLPLPAASTSTSLTAVDSQPNSAIRESADEMKSRIIAELTLERQELDLAIAEERRLADLALQQERAKGLSEAALTSLLSSTSFLDFLETSSKVVQRALADPYDYLRDYSLNLNEENTEKGGEKVRLLGSWYDEKWGRGRSVTGVDWSYKFPELFVASYNKNPLAVNDPDGIVAVWNLHLSERPEFIFHAQSDVLSVAFTPFNPHLIIGGTYSGQILLWDTRSRHPNPVLKTPLSASGHTHPVYSLSLVGTQNAHNLISASTDGTICAWTLDLLARPQEALELTRPGHTKTDEVSVTSLGFPKSETATFWVGTEEGNVYAANRYDRAGSKAGLVQTTVYRGHEGPVLGMDFHPGQEGAVELGELFLTCGVDWTVKLWRTALGTKGASKGTNSTTTTATSRTAGSVVEPILSFEEADDYVYDVKWHPHHPALFGSVDGAGKFDLWNLNVDTEVPIISTSVPSFSSSSSTPSTTRGLNKLAWDRKEGKRAAIGSADGRVYVYELNEELIMPTASDFEMMRLTCKNAA